MSNGFADIELGKAVVSDALEIGSVWAAPELTASIERGARLHALDPSNVHALWVLGVGNHNLAVLESKGASVQAQTSLKKLLQLVPDNPLAMAYLGNGTIMVARDSRNVMTKASTVKRGLEFLDKAVELAPDDIVIRLLRANSGRRLPKLFGRKRVAKDDFRHLIKLLRPSADRRELLAEACYELALLSTDADDLPDRVTLLRDAAQSAPTSEWGRKASEALTQAA